MSAELYRPDKPGRNAETRQRVRQRVYFTEQETAELSLLGRPAAVIEALVREHLARRRLLVLEALVTPEE